MNYNEAARKLCAVAVIPSPARLFLDFEELIERDPAWSSSCVIYGAGWLHGDQYYYREWDQDYDCCAKLCHLVWGVPERNSGHCPCNTLGKLEAINALKHLCDAIRKRDFV